MSGLKAGVGRANLTPYVGMVLSGFGGRDHGAEGVHDELWAKALVLESSDCRLGLVACDLIGLTPASVRIIRERAAQDTGLAPENILVAATHTHSGPAMGCLRLLGQDPEWVAVAERKIAGALSEAARNMTEAQIGLGMGEVRIGINRRERTAEGTLRLGRNPEGPLDPTVGVLRVDTLSGRPLATLIHHACHPVVLGGTNYLLSADFPGVAVSFVEQAVPGVTALFLNGCAGDINSEPVGGTFADARRLGVRLGAEAVKTFTRVELVSSARLGSVTEWTEAPVKPLPPVDEVQALLEQRRQALAAEVSAGRLSPEKRDTDHLLGWAQDVLSEWNKPARPRVRRLEVQAVRLGEVALVTTPGETFTELGAAIRAASPFTRTLVCGYTNGNVGYLPTDAAFEEGGYEIDSAYKFYYGTYSFAPGTEGAVVSAGVRALERLSDT